jgi:succinate-semialdehyde dehydrogenase / glutarate-semialdehyde dehydrogenase
MRASLAASLASLLTALVHEGEKNSFKLSGMGWSRMGPASLGRFVRRTSYLMNRSHAADPWWHRT